MSDGFLIDRPILVCFLSSPRRIQVPGRFVHETAVKVGGGLPQFGPTLGRDQLSIASHMPRDQFV